MIFYFSGTGNTRWAAKEISKATGDRLLNIAEEIQGECRYHAESGERIGFCFPVHGWRPPLLVRRFIQKMHIQQDGKEKSYCWALCTAGDDIGLSMEYLNRDLAGHGLHTTSVFSLIMPESFVGLPFMDVDRPEKEHAKITIARQQLAKVIDVVTRREQEVCMTHRGHWPRTNSYVLGTAFVKWIVRDTPFHVQEERCLRCGTCAKMCPVDNIESPKGETPVWKHNGQCLTCFACYHHCPVHAIEFGRQTKHKGQYYFKG